MENVNISKNLSTLGNAFIQKELYTTSSILATGSISTMENMNIHGSLSTLGNAFIQKELYTTSSILATGSFSTLEDVNVTRNVSVLGNLYVHGTVQFDQSQTNLQNLVISTLVTKYYISSLSSIAAGTSLNVGGSTLFQGTVSAFSNFNIAGLLSTNSTVVVGDSLFVTNTGFFGSSVNMQSSLTVACNVTVGRTLTTSNLNINGSTFISTLAVTNTFGFGFNVSSSTLHYGLFSTAGAMNIGGIISTTNALIVGSTIDTQYLRVDAGMSVFSNAGFAQDIFARSSMIVGTSTVTNTLYGTGAANLLTSLTVGTPGSGNLSNYGSFSNGGAVAIVGAVNIQGVTTLLNSLNIGPYNTFLNNSSNVISNATWMSSLTTGYQSTVGQAAFYSSVQIQGGLSVFSSISAYNITITSNLVASNMNITGTLTNNGTTLINASGAFTAPGINSAGQVGINSSSNASYSLFVTGAQSNTGNLGIGGNVTATSFYGNGANLTGINATSITFPNQVWINSSDGINRLNYMCNSHSYYKTADAHIFRDSADNNLVQINGSGGVNIKGDLSVGNGSGQITAGLGYTISQLSYNLYQGSFTWTPPFGFIITNGTLPPLTLGRFLLEADVYTYGKENNRGNQDRFKVYFTNDYGGTSQVGAQATFSLNGNAVDTGGNDPETPIPTNRAVACLYGGSPFSICVATGSILPTDDAWYICIFARATSIT